MSRTELLAAAIETHQFRTKIVHVSSDLMRNFLLCCIGALFLCQVQIVLGSERIYNEQELQRGKYLFQNKCAVCHGQNGEGTVTNWQQRDEQGKLPPPPLNGTAHTWHHSIPVLFRTIKEGTGSLGGSMPAWDGELSDDEILLIINWITSLWSDEIYNTWRDKIASQ